MHLLSRKAQIHFFQLANGRGWGEGGHSGDLIHIPFLVPDVWLAEQLHLALRPCGLFQQPRGSEGK